MTSNNSINNKEFPCELKIKLKEPDTTTSMGKKTMTSNNDTKSMNTQLKAKKTRRGGKNKKTTYRNHNKTDNIVAVSLRYKNFVETTHDQSLLNRSMELRAAWIQEKARAPPTAIEEQPQTKWVRKFTTDFMNDRFKDIKIHDAVKVQVKPLALNNICHHNAKFYSQHLAECEVVFGYNIFACKCGKRVEGEAHSINKVKGEYIDFTEDYDGEKTKWFIPINTNGKTVSNEEITLHNPARLGKQGLKTIDLIHSNRGCKCIAYKDAIQTNFGKFPIDDKLVKRVISFWEQ